MRHPFDGILRSETEQTDLSADFRQSAVSSGGHAEESRRDALKQFIAGGAVAFGLAESPLRADEAKPRTGGKPAAVSGYGRYLVVPVDFRSLKTDRRTQLAIGGGYFRREMKRDEKSPRAGFLAWLTPDAAMKLAARKGVREVVAINPDDVPGPGVRPASASQLAVPLIPNAFRKARPPKGSFVETADLLELWSKKFPAVKFKLGGSAGMVLVNIGPAGMPESLPKELKKHPQVVGVQWQATATTLAVGEEGATTKALGEEAASTRRRGEEGGPTTLAIGEEGGPATTALREAGGGSTRALGEEGGRPPLTRARREAGKIPPGTVTTQALGEEGTKGR